MFLNICCLSYDRELKWNKMKKQTKRAKTIFSTHWPGEEHRLRCYWQTCSNFEPTFCVSLTVSTHMCIRVCFVRVVFSRSVFVFFYFLPKLLCGRKSVSYCKCFRPVSSVERFFSVLFGSYKLENVVTDKNVRTWMYVWFTLASYVST